ncbi:hypothetical protein [Halopelagius inordinatus]|uniref:hypothetical protein n=1 Tax=Halopelagius inordinatus TaxID=553467 RepID=UPI0011603B93|nr:hypothetical protein [Halopelagius inordinatus]
MSNFSVPAGTPVADKEVARSFHESGLSVSTGVNTYNGGGFLSFAPASRASPMNYTEDFVSSESANYERGLKFTPAQNDVGVWVTTYPAVEPRIIRLRDASDNTLLKEIQVDPIPGRRTTFPVVHSLDSSKSYKITATNPNAEWSHSNSNSSPTVNNSFITVEGETHGLNTVYTNNTGTFGEIGTLDPSSWPATGSQTAEFIPPVDVFGWDTTTFLATEPGGSSVEVYIEELQSGGWTEIAGPVSRGASIEADPANNIRWRIDYDRGTETVMPSVRMLARRWKL